MAYVLYLGMLVMAYLRPIELMFPDNTIRWVLIFSIIAFLIGLLSKLTKKSKDFEPLHFALIGVFIFSIAASQLLRGWIGGVLVGFAEFAVPTAFFLLTAWTLTSVSRIKTTAGVLVVCGVVLSAGSILAYTTGFMADLLLLRQAVPGIMNPVQVELPSQDESSNWLWRVRSVGFLNDPNDFGQFLVVCLVFLCALACGKGAFVWRLLALPAAGTMLYAIYLTFSRGSLLGISSIVCGLLMYKLGALRTALIATPIVLAVSGYTVGSGRGFDAGEESAGGRIEAWSVGLEMLRNSPIFGVGYEGFLDFHGYTAHNSWVLCFAELGLVGYYAWLGLLVLAIVPLVTLIRNVEFRQPEYSPERLWTVSLSLAILGFLVCAFFLSRTYSTTLFILISMSVPVVRLADEKLKKNLLNARNQLRNEDLRTPFMDLRTHFIWTSLTLVATVIGFKIIVISYWRIFG